MKLKLINCLCIVSGLMAMLFAMSAKPLGCIILLSACFLFATWSKKLQEDKINDVQ